MKQPALIISWVTNTNVLNLITPDAIAPLPSHRWGEGPHVKKLNEFVIDDQMGTDGLPRKSGIWLRT